MPFYDAFGINCKTAQLLKIKAQISIIWAKGYKFANVCVFSNLS